tara:strand:+ start:896 stop:1405 length:510 start_codon:yes stop_codon:yes gene_type:complete
LKQFKKTWPIRVEKEIKANSDEIWKIISKEGNLNLVHPFCKNNYAISWGSENSVDVLEYLNGLKFIREFQTWNPGKGYSLLIGTKNGKKSYVEWKIRSKNKKQYLSITVYTHYMIKYPKFISFFPYEFMVKPNLKKYLESVIGGINYYLTKNKTVPKNNFGEHNWFSKK